MHVCPLLDKSQGVIDFVGAYLPSRCQLYHQNTGPRFQQGNLRIGRMPGLAFPYLSREPHLLRVSPTFLNKPWLEIVETNGANEMMREIKGTSKPMINQTIPATQQLFLSPLLSLLPRVCFSHCALTSSTAFDRTSIQPRLHKYVLPILLQTELCFIALSVPLTNKVAA